MNLRPKSGEARGRTATGIAAASVGLVLFALCSHQGMPWLAVAAAALLMTAAVIGWLPFGDASTAGVLGLDSVSVKIALFSLVGVGIGTGGGLWHRSALGIALQPVAGVEAFVIVACLIGATEELVFRGWILGKARAFGWPAAVIIAAVAHAAYKTALFAWPAVPVAVDLAGIARWTVAGGMVLGLLRAFSGSVVPSLVAHAVFDFVVYRCVAHAPWWVWG